jgi:hypothetical protein
MKTTSNKISKDKSFGLRTWNMSATPTGKLYSIGLGQFGRFIDGEGKITFYACNRTSLSCSFASDIAYGSKKVKSFKSAKAALNHIMKVLDGAELQYVKDFIERNGLV